MNKFEFNSIEGEIIRFRGLLKQIDTAFGKRAKNINNKLTAIENEMEGMKHHILKHDEYNKLIEQRIEQFRKIRTDMNTLFYKIFVAWCKYYDFDIDTIIKKRMQIDEWNVLIGYLRHHDLGYSFLGRKFDKDHSTIINVYKVHEDLLTNNIYRRAYFEFKSYMDSLLEPDIKEIDLSELDGQLENQRLYIKKRLKKEVGLTLTHELIENLMG